MTKEKITILKDTSFITPKYYEKLTSKQIKGPRGWLLFAACNAGIDLGRKVTDIYNNRLKENGESKQVHFLNDFAPDNKLTTLFEDGSTKATLPDHVAGSHVCVFQPVVDMKNEPNVNDNFMQLFQVIRTLKTHDAKTITAVIPYMGYSRQDVPTFLKRECSGAKLIADLLGTSGFDNLWTYHPHANSIKCFYEPHKVVALSGLDLFLGIFDKFKDNNNAIVVSTDAGGAKFSVNYASKMGLPYAIANKFRQKEFKTEALGVIGDFRGKDVAILTDDESVSAGSLLNVSNELHDNSKYGIKEIYIAISHNKIMPEAVPKIIDSYNNHGLKELHVTNSIPQRSDILDLPFVHEHPLEEIMAYSLNRIHYDRSIRKVFFE
jgi:ribose-phosphate pyrophosphokinase